MIDLSDLKGKTIERVEVFHTSTEIYFTDGTVVTFQADTEASIASGLFLDVTIERKAAEPRRY